ncbi:hypothetical protein NPIL_195141 [Nephila pilipes]|uniref:Uncharacterized protein n=1 Tax=Nephila pilipes TaxID=299642 RepID=A0A8X6N4P4_NEPPI|nr:hypothetical protein NPIL_195141 [Nephila pilipes]
MKTGFGIQEFHIQNIFLGILSAVQAQASAAGVCFRAACAAYTNFTRQHGSTPFRWRSALPLLQPAQACSGLATAFLSAGMVQFSVMRYLVNFRLCSEQPVDL